MKNIEYAIVDIETTGGHASGSRITEVAILIHNGTQVTERFESLVNPGRPIPFAITGLTGIDDELVRDAPCFSEIAPRVHQLLEGRVFVAHHVNFDYSFVRNQLEEAGFPWTARKLCTVRLSRKVHPGLPSYSLGRLCSSLGIPLYNRHRAGGDADATALLFGRLLAQDVEGQVAVMLKKTSKEQQLPPNVPKSDVEGLPTTPGVYYFRDRTGRPVYIGKATNLRKRVTAHFSGHNVHAQRQGFLRHIHSITFERCGTELMALLLECIEIKRHWPAYNRALKRFEPKFGMFVYERMDGFLQLSVGAIRKHQPILRSFHRMNEGICLLRELTMTYELDRRDHPSDYNSRVEAAVSSLQTGRNTFAIIDQGRDDRERSCIWVENGDFYGMGYVSYDCDLYQAEDVRDSLTRHPGNHYMMQLIRAYAERCPHKVVAYEE